MAGGKTAIIYSDGGCSGNPGPAGAGYVIMTEDGQDIADGCVPLGHGTNNIAEYRGAIAGLEHAAKLGLTDVTVRSDSELLCKQVWGQYRVKNPALKKLHVELRNWMRKFERVVFEHVPREHNEAADALAREAVRKSKRMGR